MFHCTAGKDRTGIAAALVLTILGVPRETIIEDFEMSNRYYHYASAAGVGEGRGPDPAASPFAHLWPEARAVFASVDGRYLQATFADIEAQYGSVEAYLAAELDIDADNVARLRSLYLE
ncbi:MAG: tyrosine-protein phosphatase [Alphaproteobacteria bacterium]|uniref:Tyrosine-protein phosphatase n=1 Tax=Brevundimonas mediterranea TaxID=74329 RepID=A0A7Z9C614_9CAUL|nr:tyrosine-protein phosphatase [Brevundimonas mediterranea]MBU2031218.1 tyrosine-protein phosphatase [Alphaproteobacteria bacterium]TAJ43279.1 MAG: tyrosine-protein phosphatase [Brevundimonas sp.]MBU2163111.1 tyrosine-protein phosphatase [Alphaproteobacteria bacterium]MBU2231760.1 tyrosine-protein phosphatase [Alphaproteobacteria bacterium]VDC50537.1 Tyrosine-protein phosphatase [Brevundimonas mediterranea]